MTLEKGPKSYGTFGKVDSGHKRSEWTGCDFASEIMSFLLVSHFKEVALCRQPPSHEVTSFFSLLKTQNFRLAFAVNVNVNSKSNANKME